MVGLNREEEHYREYLVSEGCIFTQDFAEEGIKELRVYFEILENLITDAESRELDRLAHRADKLPASQQGEFWTWNHPVHWDEIFRTCLRSSFVTLVFAFLEDYLRILCDCSRIIARASIGWKDLKGSTWQRARMFLHRLVGFSQPADELWDRTEKLYKIRNILVHRGGRVEKQEKDVRTFIEKRDGIEIDQYGTLEVGSEFCIGVVDTVEELVQALQAELKALCQRG